MKKKIKSTISLSLVLIMLSPSVSSAVSLGDIAQSTSTSAGTWTDPLGGGRYISGGDFKVKFKTSSYHAPLFSFKAPSMSLGCSGISLSGGFISFLGLDKLKGLISNAGSSLIFGIILGMEFTLPAISAVFNKIRAWANALQGLLQNGCNMGRAIAKASNLAGKMHAKDLSKAIQAPFDKMDKFMDGGNDWLHDIQKLGNCSGSTNDPNCKLIKDAVTSVAAEIDANEKGKGGKPSHADSVDAAILKRITTALTGKKQAATYFTLDEFYSSKKVPTSACSLGGPSMSDSDILIDKLKYVFFGDIASDAKSIADMKSDIDNAHCKLNNQKLSAVLAKSATTGIGTFFPKPTYVKIDPIITSPKDAAHALIYGFDNLDGSYPSINKTTSTITIPNRDIVYVDLPDGVINDANSTKRIRAVYVSGDQDGNLSTSLEWKGALKESFYGIRKLVDAQTGHTWRLATTYDAYDTSGISSVSSLRTPLLVQSVKKYIKAIVRMEKKQHGETQETLQLKQYLAKINAILYARALINGIESRVMQLSTGMSGKSDVINSYKDSVEKTREEVEKILTAMKKDLESNTMLTPFREIEKDQAKESLKSTAI